MNTIEVCLAPKLFDNYSVENKTIVVVDILRATTIITTMFHNGLKKLFPVKTLEEAKELKAKGFLVAAERNGKKVDFADYDNSPYTFTNDKILEKTLVYSTTNGTNTINLTKGANQIIISSFLNLSATADLLISQKKNVLILCSGWQGDYCTEDALFAGALIEKLQQVKFTSNSDSVNISVEIWNNAKNNLHNYIKSIFQYNRLVNLGLENIIDYCFRQDISDVIPIYKDNYIVDLKKIAHS